MRGRMSGRPRHGHPIDDLEEPNGGGDLDGYTPGMLSILRPILLDDLELRLDKIHILWIGALLGIESIST